MRIVWCGLVAVLAGTAAVGCATRQPMDLAAPTGPATAFERHRLELDSWWILEHPRGGQFDASGIARLPDGRFLFANDKENAILAANVAGPSGSVVRVGEFCRIEPEGRRTSRLDLEGLTVDAAGNIYVCAEAGRRIFRMDGRGGNVTELPVDWNTAERYFSDDPNASLEGIAASGRTLYVVNERSQPRILEVDLRRRAVVDDFVIVPPDHSGWILHYSGIEFHRGSMFVLLRYQKSVLEVDPVSRRAIAEYDYGAVEGSRELAFHSGSLTGFMEGVWVDDDFIWLLVDNNGRSSYARPGDTRPILIRCRLPESRKSFVSPSPSISPVRP